MKLFEEVKDKIIVTEYLPDNVLLQAFKKKEIEKIPEDWRVLSAETNTHLGIKVGRNKVNFLDLIYKENGDIYHKIQCSKLSKNEKKEIIDKYINCWTGDNLTNEPYMIVNPYDVDTTADLVKIKIDYSRLIEDSDKEMLRKLKYFLATSAYKKDYGTNFKFCMDKIINVTEGIYLYHLLLGNKFSELSGKDIEEPVKLFKPYRRITEFDNKELIKNGINLKTVGIITNNTETYYDKLMVKVKESEPILKLIKK